MRIVMLGTSCVDVYPQKGGVRDDFRHAPRDLELIAEADGLLTTASESELPRLVELRREHPSGP